MNGFLSELADFETNQKNYKPLGLNTQTMDSSPRYHKQRQLYHVKEILHLLPTYWTPSWIEEWNYSMFLCKLTTPSKQFLMEFFDLQLPSCIWTKNSYRHSSNIYIWCQITHKYLQNQGSIRETLKQVIYKMPVGGRKMENQENAPTNLKLTSPGLKKFAIYFSSFYYFLEE